MYKNIVIVKTIEQLKIVKNFEKKCFRMVL